MVQTGMTTPYPAFAQQNGDHSGAMKPDMKSANDGGGGGGGGPPLNGVNQVSFKLEHEGGGTGFGPHRPLFLTKIQRFKQPDA